MLIRPPVFYFCSLITLITRCLIASIFVLLISQSRTFTPVKTDPLMLTAQILDYKLQFKKTVRTSRGEMSSKHGYLLKVYDEKDESLSGTGECAILPGLSFDDKPDYQQVLENIVNEINVPLPELLNKYSDWPSICFALECALRDLNHGGKGLLYESDFTEGRTSIPINGLIWMGDYTYMRSQLDEKLAAGYKVIKIKVGGIDFNRELELLKYVRQQFSPGEVTLRLDANGAFNPDEALKKLEILSAYGIHSIEQPIRAGNPGKMAWLCRNSPIPIALDEELIGVHTRAQRLQLLEMVRPQYIILKPSLLGGFTACNEWIGICKELNTGYWITSALESNIGLNAIAQYTATLDTAGLAQGLGTGGLYINNYPSRLEIRGGELWFQ